MSAGNLKKFINKYQEISDCEIARYGKSSGNDSKVGTKKKSAREWLNYDKDMSWKQGADDLMNALRMNIKDLEKLNELND